MFIVAGVGAVARAGAGAGVGARAGTWARAGASIQKNPTPGLEFQVFQVFE